MRTALNIAAAVLIITCPCALGLAVPAVTTAASGRLFRRGMLIKHETALERLAQVDTVIFDKTGTLTAGTPEPENLDQLDRADIALALALARGSAHPLAQAIERAALAAGIVAADGLTLSEVPGYGTKGLYEGQEVRLGRASWVGATRVTRPRPSSSATVSPPSQLPLPTACARAQKRPSPRCKRPARRST